MSTRQRIRHFALQEARSSYLKLRKIESEAVRQVARVARKLKNIALQQQSDFEVPSKELAALVDALTQAKLYAYVASSKAAASLISRRFLRLALPINASDLRGLSRDDLDKLYSELSADSFRTMQSLTTSLTDGVRDVVEKAVSSGVNPRAAIQQYFTSPVSGDISLRNFSSIVRTQTQLMYSSAALAMYESEEMGDLVWGYEYVTVGDDRVRPTHEKYDGLILHKESSIWKSILPPNGWQCRCQVIPVFEETDSPVRLRGLIEPDVGFDFDPRELSDALPKINEASLHASLSDALLNGNVEPSKVKSLLDHVSVPEKPNITTKWETKKVVDSWWQHTEQTPAELVGAPANSTIEVRLEGTDFIIEVTHPFISDMERRIDFSNGVATNESLFLEANAPKGFGRQILKEQVINLRSLSFERIDTYAFRGPQGTASEANGYYTWFRYGYDAPFDDDDIAQMYSRAKPNSPEAKRLDAFLSKDTPATMLDLMSTNEGRELWRQLGHSKDATFFLGDGDRSVDVFNEYLQAHNEL